MEVVMAPSIPSPDFNFDSNCSTPYISAPSSPKRFGFGHDLYFSAPTSPTSSSAFYNDFNNFNFSHSRRSSSSVIPFDWEETPGTPKSAKSKDTQIVKDEDFAFNFSGEVEKSSLSAADELFVGGKIRPLKPPPGLQLGNRVTDESLGQKSVVSSPRSPIAQGKKMIRDVFSPKQRKEVQSDPFAIALEESSRTANQDRGRESVSQSSSSKPIHRSTRSLSPFRIPFEEQQEAEQEQSTKSTSSNSNPNLNSKPPLKGYRKWRLRDFLLFRSASEGRASERDPLRKYSVLTKKNEDVKNSSFRSTDSSGSGSGSRRRGPLSAHELHYTTNRAVSEELKKKTYLPYRQGFFGCMGFNPAVKGFNM